MTVLQETITLKRSPRDVFAYVADFSTCREWDSTASSSERLDEGPVGIGSRFHVVCEAPVASIDLEYEIVEFEPDSKVVLLGRGRFFEVRDTILITPARGGCRLQYTAEFTWKPMLAKLAGALQSGLEKMGRASIQEGLKTALDDNYPAPTLSKASARADKFLPRALSRFTRRGYTLGQKQWNPVSAYVGDKHVVLTGATAGLGKACAEDLARRGAELTLVVRNRAKGRELVQELKRTTGNNRIRLEIADLSLMSDVEKVIKSLKQRGQHIDILINNAGDLFNPRHETSEGLEQSFSQWKPITLGRYR